METPQTAVTVGVLSKIPNLFTQVIERLPDLESVATDRLAVTGISVNDIANSPTEGLSADIAEKLIGGCNILLADPNLVGPLLYNMGKVKWVQSTRGGADKIMKFLRNDKPYPETTLTRFAGCGQHMAEYVVGHIIAFERNFRGIFKDQECHEWAKSSKDYRLLNKLTIGIVGVGEIGSSVAKAAKHFGMTVYGLTSREIAPSSKNPWIDRHFSSLGQLPEMLQSCDYVCSTLPKTAKTNGAFMNNMLENCKEKNSIFINIGRSNVITEEEIIKAVNLKWIGGAVLDVFEEEPLPKSSPLWDLENVVITPHCSGISMVDEIADFFANNLENFLSGRALSYVVEWNKGY